MPRQGLTKEIIILKAVEIINQKGYTKLTFAVLSKELNVKPPAMFKHFMNIEDLKSSLTLAAINGLKICLKDALVGVSGEKALISLCNTYRNFARDNKGLYKAMQPIYFKDKNVILAANDLMILIISILKEFDLNEGSYIHLVRLIRSSLHGFVVLETDFNFGMSANIDESFKHQIKAILFMVKSFTVEK